jgi:hypothetical protein
MSSLYPLGTKGQWHGGIHRRGKNPVRAELPGEIVAYRLSNGLLYSSLPQRVSGADYESLPPRIRREGVFNEDLYFWTPPAGKSEDYKNEILRRMGLVMSGDFFLLRHVLRSENRKEIVFYSLYMHLKPLGSYNAPPRGAARVLHTVSDFPFGDTPPFYIRYRFLREPTEESCVCCETCNKSGAVVLPVGLALSASLAELLNAARKKRAGLLPPDKGEYTLPPTFTACPSGVCRVPEAALEFPVTQSNKNPVPTIKAKAQVYIMRPGGRLARVGVLFSGGQTSYDLESRRFMMLDDTRLLPVSQIPQPKLIAELHGAAGYFPLESLARVPRAGQTAPVIRDGMLFAIEQGARKAAGTMFLQPDDFAAAKQETLAFTSSLAGGDPEIPQPRITPVMYVRKGDMVERTKEAKELTLRHRLNGKLVQKQYIEVRFSLDPSSYEFYIRESDLQMPMLYYKIRNPGPTQNRLFALRRGTIVYQEKSLTTVSDFILSYPGNTEEFLITDTKPFADKDARALEIIRCAEDAQSSGAAGTRGYIKKGEISRYCVKWDFADLVCAKKGSARLSQSNAIQYPDEKTRPRVKPDDLLGLPGISETEEDVLHIEYFMKNSDTPFTLPAKPPRRQDIPAGTPLFSCRFPDPLPTLFKAGTRLETEKVELEVNTGMPEYPRSRKMRIKNNPAAGSWWIRYDDPLFATCGALDGNTLLLEKDTEICTYTQPPEIVVEAEQTDQRTPAALFITQEDIRPLRCVFDAANTAYWTGYTKGTAEWKTEESLYIRLTNDFPHDHGKWQNYFTKLDSGELADYQNAEKKHIFLQELLKRKKLEIEEGREEESLRDFLDRNEKFIRTCSFEHPSEWSAKRTHETGPPYREQYTQLCMKLALWDANGQNPHLPGDIQDGEKLLYFHPEVFLSHLRILDCEARRVETLKQVQDDVLNLRCLKIGGTGINAISEDPKYYSADQTFCNQAAYLVIKATDTTWTNFTGKNNLPWQAADKFMDDGRFMYIPKTTNIWCDIMLERSKNSAATGLVELSGRQAQEYANRGWTVVGVWKNLRPAPYSPHTVTVRPGYPYDETSGPVVANVGEFNRVVPLRVVHGSQYKEYRWFYNFRQGFTDDRTEIKKLEDRRK